MSYQRNLEFKLTKDQILPSSIFPRMYMVLRGILWDPLFMPGDKQLSGSFKCRRGVVMKIEDCFHSQSLHPLDHQWALKGAEWGDMGDNDGKKMGLLLAPLNNRKSLEQQGKLIQSCAQWLSFLEQLHGYENSIGGENIECLWNKTGLSSSKQGTAFSLFTRTMI